MNPRLQILYFSNATFILANSLITPYFAILISKYSNSLESIGVLQAVQILSLIITSAFLYRLKSQNLSRAHLISYGWMLAGLAWFATANISSLGLLSLIMVLNGFGNGLTNSPWNTLVAENLDQKQQLKEYSFWTIISQSMIALAALLAPFLISQFGFPNLLRLIGSIQFLSGVILLTKYPN